MVNEEICSELLRISLSNGGDYGDIFFENRVPLSIHLEDSRIEKISSGMDKGTGIRVIFNGKTAYAYTNDLTRVSLSEIASSVNHVVRHKKDDISIDLRRVRPKVDFSIARMPDTVSMDDKLRIITNADKAVRKLDRRIRQVSITYRDAVQKVFIANSEGSFCEDERVYSLFVVNVIAMDDGIIQTGYEAVGGFIGFELFENNFTEQISIRAAQRALKMIKAKRVKGGRRPVVISSDAGGTMIHEAIGHSLEADLAQQGLSVYSHKKGQNIASPLITVVDDATIPGKRGSFRFDDEGTPSQKTILVKNGVLTQYMYDRLTASKDGVSSTGNGRRESYHSRPIPRMTNTILAPGEHSSEEVIQSVPEGLFVKKMGGGQVNTVTGDFVFDVQEGYVIKNGKISELVRGATLSGNGPEILSSIDMVASEIGFSIGTCGKDSQGVPVSDAMPTIRIPDIVVGGEA